MGYTCDAWRSGGVACSVPRSDWLHEILSQDAQPYSGAWVAWQARTMDRVCVCLCSSFWSVRIGDWNGVEHCTPNHFVSVGCECNAGAGEATASCSRLRLVDARGEEV